MKGETRSDLRRDGGASRLCAGVRALNSRGRPTNYPGALTSDHMRAFSSLRAAEETPTRDGWSATPLPILGGFELAWPHLRRVEHVQQRSHSTEVARVERRLDRYAERFIWVAWFCLGDVSWRGITSSPCARDNRLTSVRDATTTICRVRIGQVRGGAANGWANPLLLARKPRARGPTSVTKPRMGNGGPTRLMLPLAFRSAALRL